MIIPAGTTRFGGHSAIVDSRRRFIGQVASGLAGTLAAPSTVLGANRRLRVALIGAGERGVQLAREALAAGDVELAAAADIYPRRLEFARQLNPSVKTCADYRGLLEDRDLDAVLIATPQHLHAPQLLAAVESGKHVYVEKTMALTLDQAKLIRDLCTRSKEIKVQVGHQWCSSGLYADASKMLASVE